MIMSYSEPGEPSMATVVRSLATGAPRLLLYAHDTYGLGHLRRSLAIAGRLAQAVPNLTTLLVTGSPVAQQFTLPPRVDSVKLPAVVKIGDDHYRARDLDLSLEQMVRLRAALISEVATHFAPDVMLVDHAPAGMKGELLPALRALRLHVPHARLVLGLRDILDEPTKVRAQWREQGIYGIIDRWYDEVLVYGQRDLFDPVRAYDFPASLAARAHFCGYIRRDDPVRPAAALRAELDLHPGPLVLVTAGGGGDGGELERASLDALAILADRRPLQAVVITGPLMASGERAALEERARSLPFPVRLLPFHPDVPGLMRAADLVVAMGGYNTTCEILAAGRPAVIVPRAHPRLEQDLRARAFAARGLLTMLPAADLTPAHLAATMLHALRQGPPPVAVRALWDGEGLARVADRIARLLPAERLMAERASA
jgi:predicted glycosyltransferase